MKDFAEPGRSTLIFFELDDKVRWHINEGNGPYHSATVIRTARTRVLIQPEDRNRKPVWVPNLHLSHDPKYHKDSYGMARQRHE